MQAQEAWRYRNSEDRACDVSRLNVGVPTRRGADVLALLRGANDALLLKGADVLALLRGTDVLALLRGINILQLMKTTLSEFSRGNTYA